MSENESKEANNLSKDLSLLKYNVRKVDKGHFIIGFCWSTIAYVSMRRYMLHTAYHMSK